MDHDRRAGNDTRLVAGARRSWRATGNIAGLHACQIEALAEAKRLVAELTF